MMQNNAFLCASADTIRGTSAPLRALLGCLGRLALKPCCAAAYDLRFSAKNPAISTAVCIIPYLIRMFNENRTFFEKIILSVDSACAKTNFAHPTRLCLR